MPVHVVTADSWLKRYRNYLFAGCACVAFTLFHVLGSGESGRWLLVSDANVLLWLFVAALLDSRR